MSDTIDRTWCGPLAEHWFVYCDAATNFDVPCKLLNVSDFSQYKTLDDIDKNKKALNALWSNSPTGDRFKVNTKTGTFLVSDAEDTEYRFVQKQKGKPAIVTMVCEHFLADEYDALEFFIAADLPTFLARMALENELASAISSGAVADPWNLTAAEAKKLSAGAAAYLSAVAAASKKQMTSKEHAAAKRDMAEAREENGSKKKKKAAAPAAKKKKAASKKKAKKAAPSKKKPAAAGKKKSGVVSKKKTIKKVAKKTAKKK